MRLRKQWIWAVMGCAMCAAAWADEAAPEKVGIDKNDVLSYLEQVIGWQKNVVAIDTATGNAREKVLSDSVKQNATLVLQNGFVFARAEASAIDAAGTDDDTTDEAAARRKRISDLTVQTDKDVAALQAEVDRGRGNQQQKQGALKLAKAKQELLHTVMNNVNSATNATSGLAGKINDLARSIPEMNAMPKAKAAQAQASADGGSSVLSTLIPLPASATAPATTDTPTPTRSEGIFGLCERIFNMVRAKNAIDDAVDETDRLTKANHDYMMQGRAALEEVMRKSNGVVATQEIDALVVQYKQIGAGIVPLGQIGLWLDATRRSLRDWEHTVNDQLSMTARHLIWRLVLLAISLMIPLVLSELVRRATGRYIKDSRRQKQLRTVRRVLTAIAVVVVLMLNFISEFGSFATFAGFLTAGLAVALQSVLLALVAHFFFYGRYGVRAGDRITAAGVTGDILQIGMIRFYLRELRETDEGLKPTGKIVAFPNSILFQPSGFYKYVDDVGA